VSDNHTFESVYQEHLAELLDAEQQILDDMPRMIRAASTQELKTALELHMAETREQAARLEAVRAESDGPRRLAFSDAMRGLLAKSRLQVLKREPSSVRDAALIVTLQQIEHLEISAYQSALQFARMLGHERAAGMLKKTLKEELETAANLTQIAESLIMGDELEDAVMRDEVAA
jgi:ferritin-like metal-binding protein YciE